MCPLCGEEFLNGDTTTKIPGMLDAVHMRCKLAAQGRAEQSEWREESSN